MARWKAVHKAEEHKTAPHTLQGHTTEQRKLGEHTKRRKTVGYAPAARMTVVRKIRVKIRKAAAIRRTLSLHYEETIDATLRTLEKVSLTVCQNFYRIQVPGMSCMILLCANCLSLWLQENGTMEPRRRRR